VGDPLASPGSSHHGTPGGGGGCGDPAAGQGGGHSCGDPAAGRGGGHAPLPNPAHYEVSSTGEVAWRTPVAGGGGGGGGASGGGSGSGGGGGPPASSSAAAAASSAASWQPLELERLYTVVTKAYLAHGKDGYAAFAAPDVEVLVGEEGGPILPTLVRNHFRILSALGGFGSLDVAAATSPARSRRLAPRAEALRRVPTLAAGGGGGGRLPRYSLAIAPVVDGRIVEVGAHTHGQGHQTTGS
jgi:hypothetical protein